MLYCSLALKTVKSSLLLRKGSRQQPVRKKNAPEQFWNAEIKLYVAVNSAPDNTFRMEGGNGA